MAKKAAKKKVKEIPKGLSKEVPKKKLVKNWKVLISSLIIVYAVALIGSFFTSNASAILEDNPLVPPGWVFAVVWNILFFLIALSLYFSWTSAEKNNKKDRIKSRMEITLVFAINLFLNMLWSIIFFGFYKADIAFYELIALWVSILSMVLVTWKIDRKSAFLLFPYLLWVSFAGILNYLIAFG